MFLRNFLKILWTEKMIHDDTRFEVVDAKTRYLELTIYRCKNDEHTPKNGDFYRKNDENILKFNF